MESDLKILGDEWSNRIDKDEIISTCVYPFITSSSRVAEIGVGGGTIVYSN
jgi:hypothetical protein